MNASNAKDYLPLVQALAEGKTIQCMRQDVGWVDLESVRFDSDIDSYRIKPEPKKQNYQIALCKDLESYWVEAVNNSVQDFVVIEKNKYFVRWLTDRIEYELPEGDA